MFWRLWAYHHFIPRGWRSHAKTFTCGAVSPLLKLSQGENTKVRGYTTKFPSVLTHRMWLARVCVPKQRLTRPDCTQPASLMMAHLCPSTQFTIFHHLLIHNINNILYRPKLFLTKFCATSPYTSFTQLSTMINNMRSIQKSIFCSFSFLLLK
jgi:hypothetical protein